MLSLNRYTLGFVALIGLTSASGGVVWHSKSANSSQTAPQASGQSVVKPLIRDQATAQARLVESYAKLPLSFEANQGQADGRVKFLSRGAGYELFLTGDDALLVLPNLKVDGQNAAGLPPAAVTTLAGRSMERGKSTARSATLRMRLIGANPHAIVTGLDELPGKVNYLIGNNPKKWHSNVSTYGRVKYHTVYPGVDLIYYGNQSGQLEYDFVIAPGADPKAITFVIEPHRENRTLHLDSHGDLVLQGDGKDIRFQKPIVYQQDSDGHRQYVEGRYLQNRKVEGFAISFSLPNYDRSKTLVIDPAIVYSTPLGTATADIFFNGTAGKGIAIFTESNTGHVYAYVSGQTCASNFPTVNPLQSVYEGGCDAFVTKFDPAASGAASVIFSTYLGGGDPSSGIAVDSAGNAYITGTTNSSNFPLMNAYQSTLKSASGNCGSGPPGSNAFLAKLSSDGSTLLYSTYFGGSLCDRGNAIALDSAGRAYIAGATNSPDLPVVNPFQGTLLSSNGNANAFAATFDTTRSGSASLLYSTYLGGTGGNNDLAALAVAVDASGAIHLAGSTGSANFPITKGFQTTQSGGFYAKLTPSGIGAGQLLYSTYLGGSYGVAVDSSGNAYVTGVAGWGDFPVITGLPASAEAGAPAGVFVAKINPSLAGSASLIYSTIVAPWAGNIVGGIAVDANGNAFITGAAYPGMPLVNPAQLSANGVMQSVNRGQTWGLLNNGLTDFPICALALDTSTSPRTLYAGTGSGTIFSSSDGGLNWNLVFQLPNFVPAGCSSFHTNYLGGGVNFLAVNPSIPSNVYAGTSVGVYQTTDRGITWNAFNDGLSSTDIEGLTFDGGTLYAGTPSGLYVLSPGATSWTETTLATAVGTIAVDPATTPHTLFTSSVSTGQCSSGAFRSTDGGNTWVALGNPNIPDCFGVVLTSFGVDTTTHPSTIYTYDAGLSDGGANGPSYYKSVDEGNTWSPITDAGVNDHRVPFYIDTTTVPSTIYASDSQNGIYKSVDGGNNWTLPFPNGPGITAMAADPTNTTPTLYGGEVPPFAVPLSMLVLG